MLGWVGSPDVWVVGGREQRPSSLPRFGLWSWPDPTYLVCGCVVHQADTVDSLQEAGKKARHAGNASGLGGRCPCLGGPLEPRGTGKPWTSRFTLYSSTHISPAGHVLTVLRGCQTLPSLLSSPVQDWGPCKVELVDGRCAGT